MKWSDAYESKSDYLKAADIPEGKTFKLFVEGVEMKELKQEGKEPETKLVVHMKGAEKALVLNWTNGETMANAYGEDTDDWSGKEIHLSTYLIRKGSFAGKRSIRVTTPNPEPNAGGEDDTDLPF